MRGDLTQDRKSRGVGRDGNVWKGLAAGVAGGLVASWTMNQFQALLSELVEGEERPHGAQSIQQGSPRRGVGRELQARGKDEEEDDAPERLANAISVGILELERSAKRQATPFARKRRKAYHSKSGRRPGEGRFSHRQAPTEDEVNETREAPLEECPECGGDLTERSEHEQFEIDLPPVEPLMTRFVTHSGYCRRCCKRVRSSHPEQISRALELRDRKAGLTERQFVRRAQALEGRLDELIDERRKLTDPDNKRLSKRLRKHREHLLRFLYLEGVEATNNRAERMLRPAVIIRKTGGCNRTHRGARAHSILSSVLATCRQRAIPIIDFLVKLQRFGDTPPSLVST